MNKKDALHYLPPEWVQNIEDWVADFEPLKERHPILNRVDLVIEGGVGTGKTMPHIARKLFPDAFWLGTDLSPELMVDGGRLIGKIDKETLQKAQRANKYPGLGMKGAIIFADCFDYDLIRDIARKTGRQYPLLTSFNALFALLDRKMNLWERKDERDIHPIEEIVQLDSPFVGQLHILNDPNLWDEGSPTNALQRTYYRLEETAKRVGWITDRVDCGLLLVRKT